MRDTAKGSEWHGHLWLAPIAVGGSAMVRATEEITKQAKKIAAHLMEASDGGLSRIKDGKFHVAGTR